MQVFTIQCAAEGPAGTRHAILALVGAADASTAISETQAALERNG
jgi:hypothetical protein